MKKNKDEDKITIENRNVREFMSQFSDSDREKVLSIVNRNDSELIASLEIEMEADILNVFVRADESKENISIKVVSDCFTEAEKIIRVVANYFTRPAHSAINQLRYCAHHILKHASTPKHEQSHEELIAAFKHCKRSVYDALDYYILEMGDFFTVVLPYLNSQEASKLERLLKTHLDTIYDSRFNANSRLEYYREIAKELKNGLTIIEKLNETRRASGYVEDIFQDKQENLRHIVKLHNEKAKLEKRVKNFKNEISNIEKRQEERNFWHSYTFSWYAIGLASVLALAAVFAKAYVESSHAIRYTDKESIHNEINLESSLTEPKKESLNPNK